MSRSSPHVAVVALARVANALFFVVTATYCLLTYSSFAYQQFIRPRLVASLASFVVWHHLWHWVFLGVTALTVVADLRAVRSRAAALAGWSYLAAMALVGLFALNRPILPAVENDGLGLRLAFLFLIPPVWLAVFDHLATSEAFRPAPVDKRRAIHAAVFAALVVWAGHAAVVPLRFKDLGDLVLSRGGLAFGVAASLTVHVAVFLAVAFALLGALAIAARLARNGQSDHWAVAATATVACWLIAARIVFASLSFQGPFAWLLAFETAVAAVAVWSGVARRLAAGRADATALETWFAPLTGVTSKHGALLALTLLPLAAFAAIERVSTFDWDFLVQNLCVLAAWVVAAAFAHAYVRARPRTLAQRPVAAAAGMVLLLAGVRGNVETGLASGLMRASFVPEFALDGYAAVDPSYRFLRRLLWVEPPASAEFYDLLRAHTLIERVPVAPIDVDFVRPLEPAAIRPPHIFLFVIDSLRRDYVSAYNPAVTFTPSLARFAAEGDAFDRSFTRYGGTGLSMAAMWTGGMLLHKEYVQPFQPMNALRKLLTANGYRPLLGMDHISAEVLGPGGDLDVLDQGRDEMQYDFCTTLAEVQTRLAPAEATRVPRFVHTRSLNLHVSKLTNRSVALAHAYDGFQGPAAAAVGRMDRCFGTFIEFLKRRGLYDDSIVILTSDHGDSLGEAKRWGHSYTLFPEIVRTPLLIRVPPAIRARFAADHDAVSFSTDLTPTLYALLGYSPADLGPIYGAPLFVPPGTDTSWRRRDAFVVASSYGPVYGVLSDNGRAFYIADAVNRRDYAYDLSSLRPLRVGVSEERRVAGRGAIRAQIEALAEAYHFSPGR